MGRPIIVTYAPGCRETIRDEENGLMVPLRDPEYLANAMERFIVEPALIAKFGKRSREIAVEKYSSDKVAAQIVTDGTRLPLIAAIANRPGIRIRPRGLQAQRQQRDPRKMFNQLPHTNCHQRKSSIW